MDQADKAYRHANGCLFLLTCGWINLDKHAERLKDEIALAIAEAEGVRSLQQPQRWSELYMTENESWKNKKNH